MYGVQAALLFLLACGAGFDVRCRRIPNGLVAGICLISVFSHHAYGFSPAGMELGPWDIGVSVLLVLILSLPGYLKHSFGAGDVKLLLALSLVFLPVQLLLLVIVSFLLLFIVGKLKKSEKIPFAPFVTLCSCILLLGG